MDISTMGTVLAIVVITYLLGLGAKLCPKIKDNSIPVIVGAADATSLINNDEVITVDPRRGIVYRGATTAI